MSGCHIYGKPATFPTSKAESMSASELPAPIRQRNRDFLPLLRQRLPHIAALGLAVGGSELLSTYPLMVDSGTKANIEWIAVLLMNRILSLLIAVSALTAVQVWLKQGRARIVAMMIAVIAIGAGTSALLSSVSWSQLLQETRMWGGGETNGPAMFMYIFWINTVFAGLLAILYEWQMRANGVMETLRAVRIAGEGVERQTLESRLSGMKARVDPELLFAVIARMEALYVKDIDKAEQLLERLIEFLRATLPRTMDAPAALEQEIKLCGAYLTIEKSLRLDVLSYQSRCDAAVTGSYFPPFVLLPLLQTLVPPRQHTAPIHLSITAQNNRDGVRIELTCHAVLSSPPHDAIEAAADALRAFFGENISIVAKAAAFGGNSIFIEVPHAAK